MDCEAFKIAYEAALGFSASREYRRGVWDMMNSLLGKLLSMAELQSDLLERPERLFHVNGRGFILVHGYAWAGRLPELTLLVSLDARCLSMSSSSLISENLIHQIVRGLLGMYGVEGKPLPGEKEMLKYQQRVERQVAEPLLRCLDYLILQYDGALMEKNKDGQTPTELWVAGCAGSDCPRETSDERYDDILKRLKPGAGKVSGAENDSARKLERAAGSH